MSKQKCNPGLYVEFLIGSQKQYSCVELERVAPDETMAHDSANRFLNNSEFNPKDLWGNVKEKVSLKKGVLDSAFLAFIKLEYRRFKNGISWYFQKWKIVRPAVRLYLKQATA